MRYDVRADVIYGRIEANIDGAIFYARLDSEMPHIRPIGLMVYMKDVADKLRDTIKNTGVK